MIKLKQSVIFLVLAVTFLNCSSYKQHIMFTAPEKSDRAAIFRKAEANTTIKKFDQLELQVYTNAGEKIIDESIAAPQSASEPSTNTRYQVDVKGNIKFPLIDEIHLDGLTLIQAEEILESQYAVYYKQPFVKLSFANSRVVVLGAPGGQVIPLTNENMRLTEILALARGVNTDAKAHNIRVLRGQQLFIADLSTFESYKESDIIIEPNDIIYVEPVRRVFRETIVEYGPLFSILASITTLVVVITQANN